MKQTDTFHAVSAQLSLPDHCTCRQEIQILEDFCTVKQCYHWKSIPDMQYIVHNICSMFNHK